MKTNSNNQTKQKFWPWRWMAAVVAILIAGSLSPFGMSALNHLDVEPLWADIVLSAVLFAFAGMIYCMICRKGGV